MGLLGLCGKLVAIGVAVVAIFIGALFSGALKSTGIFQWIDGRVDAEGGGQSAKGLVPAMHEGTPWGFTHADMPPLKGHRILVTGGNVGLGYWTARHLAAHDASVIIACRSQSKCDKAAAAIQEDTGRKVQTVLLDLSSLSSVRQCAASLAADEAQLDSLILNAGIMMPPFEKTVDGIESQIGTNHFGHFLLTQLLLPQIEAAAAAKGVATIVPVSSNTHYGSYPEGILPSIERMNDETTYHRAHAYGQSKLANVLFAQELAERLRSKNILVNSIHPGVVDTELGRHINDVIAKFSTTLANSFQDVMSTALWKPSDAALTQLYAAVSPSLKADKITGKYFHPIAREAVPHLHARNATLQKMLWKLSEDFVAAH